MGGTQAYITTTHTGYARKWCAMVAPFKTTCPGAFNPNGWVAPLPPFLTPLARGYTGGAERSLPAQPIVGNRYDT